MNTNISPQWVRGTVEKVVATYIEAWLAAWLILEGASIGDFFTEETLGIGLVAAVAALLKCITALNVGDPDSATMLEKP
jgi:hypothetical protein